MPKLAEVLYAARDEWWRLELSRHVPPRPTPLELTQQLHNGAGQLLEFIVEDQKMTNGYPPTRVIQICGEIAFYAKLIAEEFHNRQVEQLQSQPDPNAELNR